MHVTYVRVCVYIYRRNPGGLPAPNAMVENVSYEITKNRGGRGVVGGAGGNGTRPVSDANAAMRHAQRLHLF